MMQRRRFLAISAAAVTGVRAESSPSKPLLSFGLMTDVQYADADPIGERHYRESIPKLNGAVADLADKRLPFSLHLGDVIDRDFESYGVIMPLFDKLGHPVKHLMGNHEFYISEDKKKEIPGLLGMPSDYYAFTVEGVRFLMLDTNDASPYKYAAESPEALVAGAACKAARVDPGRGGISTVQLEWLEKELAQGDESRTPTIICGHHPLLPAKGTAAWNQAEVLKLIDRHPCVRACFAGHQHSGDQVVAEGVPFITFKSMLYEPGITAYSVVRLHQDRLVIEGRGREASREVPLRPWK